MDIRTQDDSTAKTEVAQRITKMASKNSHMPAKNDTSTSPGDSISPILLYGPTSGFHVSTNRDILWQFGSAQPYRHAFWKSWLCMH